MFGGEQERPQKNQGLQGDDAATGGPVEKVTGIRPRNGGDDSQSGRTIDDRPAARRWKGSSA